MKKSGKRIISILIVLMIFMPLAMSAYADTPNDDTYHQGNQGVDKPILKPDSGATLHNKRVVKSINENAGKTDPVVTPESGTTTGGTTTPSSSTGSDKGNGSQSNGSQGNAVEDNSAAIPVMSTDSTAPAVVNDENAAQANQNADNPVLVPDSSATTASTTEKATGMVKTGDESSVAFWVVLLTISAMGLAAIGAGTFLRRKQKQ